MATETPLGDTQFMYGMTLPTCEECGTTMEPKVFFGHVYGWRCPTCNPMAPQIWKMEAKRNGN